jgi:hypothetical protein
VPASGAQKDLQVRPSSEFAKHWLGNLDGRGITVGRADHCQRSSGQPVWVGGWQRREFPRDEGNAALGGESCDRAAGVREMSCRTWQHGRGLMTTDLLGEVTHRLVVLVLDVRELAFDLARLGFVDVEGVFAVEQSSARLLKRWAVSQCDGSEERF